MTPRPPHAQHKEGDRQFWRWRIEHKTAAGFASYPSNMLRMVPLPIFDGEDVHSAGWTAAGP
jgi:hypothetical protein